MEDRVYIDMINDDIIVIYPNIGEYFTDAVFDEENDKNLLSGRLEKYKFYYKSRFALIIVPEEMPIKKLMYLKEILQLVKQMEEKIRRLNSQRFASFNLRVNSDMFLRSLFGIGTDLNPENTILMILRSVLLKLHARLIRILDKYIRYYVKKFSWIKREGIFLNIYRSISSKMIFKQLKDIGNSEENSLIWMKLIENDKDHVEDVLKLLGDIKNYEHNVG